jgi:AbrB family looped-hinge helix DNA binding protein
MSSRGQVVIPESVRKQLGLEAGTHFMVLGKGDVVILKAVRLSSIREFAALIAEVRRQARAAGAKRSRLARAIARVTGRTR